MPKGSNHRLKLYYLSRILLEKTDSKHSLTMAEIRSLLEEKGVTADRKTLYEDIDLLHTLGIHVVGEKAGRNYCYHVESKQFELAELKLLVDAIQSSRFVTVQKSRELIRKLTGLTSSYEARELQRQVYVQGRIKSMNDSIYHNVDAIHTAIAYNRTIRFEYLRWNLNKKMEPRRKGLYEVSPWALTWDHENYYLIAFDKEADKVKHYRVDKMRKIRMTEEARQGSDLISAFDLAKYTKKSFGMFGGKEADVRLRFQNDIVGVMLDRFGKDISIRGGEETDWSETVVKVAVSDQFFGWIFALGEKIRIVGPEDVRELFRNEIAKMNEIYSG